ncbi:hypothetical protein EVAR_98931_1 [Eumeta japonica]|uniref:Uncharacterized protein n=1 Tax=Eumeta variegata TaxID=151549 RepID=A0A4C1ZZ09_EUMVA|nr:hypothetical protein EVAR_98931_1 [Eumeta japonica]
MHGLTTTTINNKSNLLSSKGFIGFSDSAGARCLAAIDSSIRIGTRNETNSTFTKLPNSSPTPTHPRTLTTHALTHLRKCVHACERAMRARACIRK